MNLYANFFVDHDKAFDCVEQEALLNSLRRQGTNEYITRLPQSVYANAMAVIRQNQHR